MTIDMEKITQLNEGGALSRFSLSRRRLVGLLGAALTLKLSDLTGKEVLVAFGEKSSGPIFLRNAVCSLRRVGAGSRRQFVVAFIGDSYTQASYRYVAPFAKYMQEKYGSAGVGWIGFGWRGDEKAGRWGEGRQPVGIDGSARPDLVTTVMVFGEWECRYNSPENNTPSMSCITSKVAGDCVRFNVPEGHGDATIFYSGNGTGVIAVSWDDGLSYSQSLELSQVGAGYVSVSGLPQHALTIRLKVISGDVSLAGVDMKSRSGGVRVHKLGGSGSKASHWSKLSSDIWSAQIRELGSSLHVIMLGTNDQRASESVIDFAKNLHEIIARIRSSLPESEIMLLMPPENQRKTNTIPMVEYAKSARFMAAQYGVSFLDLQFFFGSPSDNAIEYSYLSSSKPWFEPDLIHPSAVGGWVIAKALVAFLSGEGEGWVNVPKCD